MPLNSLGEEKCVRHGTQADSSNQKEEKSPNRMHRDRCGALLLAPPWGYQALIWASAFSFACASCLLWAILYAMLALPVTSQMGSGMRIRGSPNLRILPVSSI
jgi:hypothetical protein